MEPAQARQSLLEWYEQVAAAPSDAQSAALALARRQALVELGDRYLDGGSAAAAVPEPDPVAAARAEALRSWGTHRAID